MSQPTRNPRSGIVLISTLLSLTLLVGLALLVQSVVIANLRTVKAIENQHREAMERQALFELLRPLAVEGLQFKPPDATCRVTLPVVVDWDSATAALECSEG